jgi:hypothetical protein
MENARDDHDIILWCSSSVRDCESGRSDEALIVQMQKDSSEDGTLHDAAILRAINRFDTVIKTDVISDEII